MWFLLFLRTMRLKIFADLDTITVPWKEKHSNQHSLFGSSKHLFVLSFVMSTLNFVYNCNFIFVWHPVACIMRSSVLYKVAFHNFQVSVIDRAPSATCWKRCTWAFGAARSSIRKSRKDWRKRRTGRSSWRSSRNVKSGSRGLWRQNPWNPSSNIRGRWVVYAVTSLVKLSLLTSREFLMSS